MKRLIIFLLFFGFSSILAANPFIRIQNLHKLNNSSIRSLSQDENGALIINANDGKFQYDGYSLKYTKKGEAASEVSRYLKTGDGRIYKGSGHGLLAVSPDGSESEVPLDGLTGLPVTCVFEDADKNIWIGTYYNGLFFKGANGECIDFAHIPDSMQNIRSLILDKHNNVWAFTDNAGVYRLNYDTGQWTSIKRLGGRKFHNACHDGENNRIWAYDTEHGLVCIDYQNNSITEYRIEPLTNSFGYALLYANGELYLGGEHGICRFAGSENGNAVLSPIGNLECPVYDMLQDSNGTIWIAGGGLYTLEGNRTVRRDHSDELTNSMCHDIDIDADNRIWIAVIDKGLALFENGEISIYNKAGSGLASDYANTVTCTNEGEIVVGSLQGLSIFNPANGSFYNYGEASGVTGNTMAGRSSILMYDGSVWVGNHTGITIYNGKSPHSSKCKPIRIYEISIDGKPVPEDSRHISLTYRQKNISFSVSDFDYEQNSPSRLEYFSNGTEKEMTRIEFGSPVSFNEMSAGKHGITFRQTDLNAGTYNDIDIEVRIRRAWYNSRLAQVIYILLCLSIVIGVINIRTKKKNLEERLRQRESEMERSTMFFVDLSYNIRTPINIIIGLFEKYFKDYGRRSTGAEQLDEIYQNATKIREMISRHIDSQEALSNDSDTRSDGIRKNARFVNAATGAIERYLFAGERIDVSVLCKEMHMGKTQLTKILKEASGMTPRLFIEEVKLKHAHTLLEEGNMRVVEISSLLNFSSPGYFSMKFKNKYGHSPSTTLHYNK